MLLLREDTLEGAYQSAHHLLHFQKVVGAFLSVGPHPYQMIGNLGSTAVWHFRGIFVAEPRGL